MAKTRLPTYRALDIGFGGANVYRESVSELIPKGALHENNDGSQYSNVIGFQILAERNN